MRIWLKSAIAALFIFIWFCFFWAAPHLTQIPDNFQYQADVFSRDNFYNEEERRFTGEILSFTRFNYNIAERSGNALLISNAFEVRKPTGENVFSVKRLYGVDRRTWKHIPDLGDRKRAGYLFGPPGADRQPYTYWHVNYDTPALMTFQDQEDILGLKVFRYSCDYHTDQTTNLRYLPGVPKKRGVELDIHLDVWIEPSSGWLVKYEDHTTAWYYDVKTRQRLHPWNKFSNQYTEASIADQVGLALRAKQRILWAGPWGALAFMSLLFVLGIAALLYRRDKTAEIFAFLASNPGFFQRRVTLASAMLSALLGLAVMAGHFFRVPALVQVFPYFAAMQFNTALGFFITGMGLWGYLSENRCVAQGCAFMAGALGLMTLVQYVFKVNLGIDQLIMRPIIDAQTLAPGRMAPLTALCFAFSGMAILSIVWDQAFLTGLLASTILAIGGSALLGYGLDLPQIYSLGPWTSMALHTSIGFVVLGAGFLVQGWPSLDSKTGLRRLVFYAGLGGIVVLFLLYFALKSREALQIHRLFSLEADRTAGRIADKMDERLFALQRMANRWVDSSGTPKAVWARDASRYLQDFPGFQAIVWADNSYRVRWIVPAQGNQSAQNLNLRFETNRKLATETAARTREMVVSHPVKLIMGPRGFLACFPLYLSGGRFDGFIIGVFRYDLLMDILITELAAQGHAVALQDADEEVYRRGPWERILEDWTVKRKIHFGKNDWQLTVSPRPEWVASARSSLPEVILGGGIAILALAALCLVLSWKATMQTILLQREAQAGKRRETQFKEFLEGAPDAIVVVNSAGRIVLVNAQAEILFGYNRDELLGMPVELLVPDRFKAKHPSYREGYFKEPRARAMGAGLELYALRKDKKEFPVEISLSPLNTEEGQLTMSAIRDVSERQEIQRQITSSLKEKEVLLKEVHHRVKNNLQVVASLLNMQSRLVKDKQDLELFKDSQSRVLSMALVHQKLYQSPDLANVDFSDYIKVLVQELSQSYQINPGRISTKTYVEGVHVEIETAIPLGLIVNELLSNALKYAFPGNRPGEIEVRLAQINDGFLALTVTDNGIGLPKGFKIEGAKSIGMQIVQDLVKQMKGQLEIGGETGTRIAMTFPNKEPEQEGA